ncbi:alpha/beta hydrolase [Streptomyces sp. NPDC003035]|uniref:alpha/beta hydrolase n=1 Tax=Streptomyces sp. NPDC003035 TaxID=3364676 RepID=UPI0036BAFB02
MLSIQELKDLKLTELTEAGEGWGDVSKRAYESRRQIDSGVVPKLTDVTKGMSTIAAAVRLGRLSRNYQYIHTECGLVQFALNGLAQELAAPQRKLVNALEDAKHLGFTVHPDGSVSYPAAGPEVAGQKPQGDTVKGTSGFFSGVMADVAAMTNLNPNAAKAQDIADTIGDALAEARRIDAEYANAVRRLKAEQGLDVTENTWADVNRDSQAVHGAADDVFKDDIPTGKSPAERKEWWDGLSQDDKIAYMAAYPDTIGNLDGIPAVARDEANRNYMPQLMGQLSERGGEDAETKLAGLRKIDEQLRAGGQPPMYLLGVGDQGNGRAIVAYGNPDTSRNVSAYVPGLSTKLDEEFAGGTLKRARDTAIGAQEIDPSSASIVWLGYDAPLSVDVMTENDAANGAPAYQSFMGGLAATNDYADPHITAIGHSYGSLTVGTASQQPGGMPDVDDYILLGSPGVGVDRAEDLGVGKQHVFVGAAENDIVTKLPSGGSVVGGVIGGAGGFLVGGPAGALVGAGVGADLGDLGDDDVWFGKDPASEAFGATRFRTEEGPNALTNLTLEAHSNYFDPQKDQMSADSIANIVAGNPGGITPEARR